MKTQRFLFILTVVNCLLLVLLVAQMRPVEANSAAGVLRGRALEIVDDRGRVRASIKMHPADDRVRKPSGRTYPETVMFRLIDANGRPEVKMGASVDGAGLSLMGEFDTTQILLDAQGGETFVRMTTADGRRQEIKP